MRSSRGGGTARAAFTFLSTTGSFLLAQGGPATVIQVTGGSARRAMAGRGLWAAGSFGVRALTNAAALELREHGIHVALLIVDAGIEPLDGLLRAGRSRRLSTLARSRRPWSFLAEQGARSATHELPGDPARRALGALTALMQQARAAVGACDPCGQAGSVVRRGAARTCIDWPSLPWTRRISTGASPTGRTGAGAGCRTPRPRRAPRDVVLAENQSPPTQARDLGCESRSRDVQGWGGGPPQRSRSLTSRRPRRSGSARTSISVILPPRTVKPATENGRPSRRLTVPAAPLTRVGWM